MKTKANIIPSRLKEIRLENNMSMAQFSEAIDGALSDSRITLIENGKATLPIQHAILISQRFGYDLNYIYYQESDNENSKIREFDRLITDFTLDDLKLANNVINKILDKYK